MYKSLLISAVGLALLANAQAQIIFFDDFSYTDGALAGQGGWLQNGTSATSPVQVSAGQAVVGVTGQDVNKALATPFSWTASGQAVFKLGATITMSSVSAAGDYFLHWSPAISSTIFVSRLNAKSDGAGGYLLGYVETSGTGASLTYGTTPLALNQSYDVVIKYSAIPSAADTAEVFVNGTSYLTDAWTSTLAETTTIGAVNLRQGGSTSGASLRIDNLFVEVVPEPASATLIGLGLAGLLIARRRS